MEDKPRDQEKLSNAFIEGDKVIAGHRLRPFTFGTAKLAKKMGLTMFTGEDDDLSEEEMLDQLAAFVWMQSQPVDEVVDAVRSGQHEYFIDIFAMDLPISSAADFMEEINSVHGMVAEAAVDVESQPSDTDKDAPPN